MATRAKTLRPAAEFEVRIPEPFDFDLTVAKPAGWSWCSPGEVFRDGTIWAGIYMGERAVGLRLNGPGPEVKVAVYADFDLEPLQLDQVRLAVETGLGKDLDLKGFYRFARSEPVLALAVGDLYGLRPGRLDDLFGRVILAISLQMAQLKRSTDMMADILKEYGMRLRFDGETVLLWPTPRRIASLQEGELREKANMGYRAKLLSSAARYLKENPMTILEMEGMAEAEAVKKVREIPGIGEYSTGIILGRSTAPIDAWSVVIMSEILLGRTPEKPREDIDRMNAILRERWGKWSWMAFVYIMNDLPNISQTYRLSRLT